MEITSLKKAVKDRLNEIDDYMNNLPDVKVLDWNQKLNKNIIDTEWVRILNANNELNRIIMASEYLQSKITEAISILSNNLEIEIQQKNMLKKSLDILQVRTKPLYNERPTFANLIYFYQSQSKYLRSI